MGMMKRWRDVFMIALLAPSHTRPSLSPRHLWPPMRLDLWIWTFRRSLMFRQVPAQKSLAKLRLGSGQVKFCLPRVNDYLDSCIRT
jgi:hypothetical protein